MRIIPEPPDGGQMGAVVCVLLRIGAEELDVTALMEPLTLCWNIGDWPQADDPDAPRELGLLWTRTDGETHHLPGWIAMFPGEPPEFSDDTSEYFDVTILDDAPIPVVLYDAHAPLAPHRVRALCGI